MKRYLFVLSLLALILLAEACKKDPVIEPPTPPVLPVGATEIPASSQRLGDASDGWSYLVTGNYVSSGIPYNLFVTVFGEDNENILNRTDDNAVLAPDYTAITAFNGVKLVVANCLQCHGQELNGEFIVGLGNTISPNFTVDQSNVIPLLDLVISNPSDTWDAYEPFRRAVLATGPHLITAVRGTNPADKLAGVLAAYRDKNDLSWIENPQIEIPTEVIPTDVPAWWLLKKKNAMFYAGGGRGDFARIVMASSLLTMNDSSDARVIDEHFIDVLAYLNSVEAPVYTESINQTLVGEGKALFNTNCASCHGTYGAEESYPNLLISLDRIGTDPALSISNFSENAFLDWYNTGWFGQGIFAGNITTTSGYVAPPLDGIWATAPYLHNGSVPTLEELLNSSQRPTYWKRSYDTNDYDFVKVGWNYSAETSKTDTETYDVTLQGYGNQGHTFGDHLSEEERGAVVEYLKTL